MILFSKIIPNDTNLSIINLTSYCDNIKRLNLNYAVSNSFLPYLMSEQDELDFDYNVHYDIINNPVTFSQLFNDILIPYVSGNIVIVLINDDIDLIVQSFIKFLNLRYGIECSIINNYDDYLNIVNDISPVINDVDNYDYDLLRYHNLLDSGVLVQCHL